MGGAVVGWRVGGWVGEGVGGRVGLAVGDWVGEAVGLWWVGWVESIECERQREKPAHECVAWVG